MHNSTLISIIGTFTKDEMKKFEDLVRSPYFNKNSNVIKLLCVIKKHYPDLTGDSVKRENVWKQIFEDKVFNYGVMKNLIYELQKLSERFLSLQSAESDTYRHSIDLLKSLKDKNLYQLFEKNVKSLKSTLSQTPDDSMIFYYRYKVEEIEQSYLSLMYRSKDENFCNAGPMNLNFISYFLSNFFSDNYNNLHDSKFYNKRYDMLIPELVNEFYSKTPAGKNDFVMMNHLMLKLTDKEDETTFSELKNLLYKNYDNLKKEIRYNLSIALINFCNFRIMKGDTGFIEEQFVIYKLMILHGFYNNGRENFINENMYVNAVSMAGNLKEFEWAEKFIADYREKLQPACRNKYFALANVSLNIKKKNFELALKHLSDFKIVDVFDKVTLKRFQAIIYYESGYFDELYSLIDSSKHFIANDKKMTDSIKEVFDNFLNFTLKLADLSSGIHKSKPDDYSLKILKDEIGQKNVSNKIWLLEKTMELEELLDH